MNRLAVCPFCSKEIQVPSAAGGRRARCPQCSATLRVEVGDEDLQLVPLCADCGEPHEVVDTL